MTKTFDYEEESGKLGKHHAGTSDTGQFWGDQGAGVLPLAKSTGKILLSLRSPYVNEPNTWGVVGGAIDKNENPKNAALRELQEELGYNGPINIIPAYTFKTEDFQYHNFIGVVPDEFEISTDWENKDAKWFDLENLPSPLHFGVKELISNSGDLINKVVKSTKKKEALVRNFIKLLLS